MTKCFRCRAGSCFLLLLTFALLSVGAVGCSNSSGPEATAETPKPPPANIDPATGRPKAGGSMPASPAVPGGPSR